MRVADQMSAAHGALLEHFQAREFEQAIVDAERVLSLAGSPDADPEQRSLVFGASAMWLQMQAGRMAHQDLASAAGKMYERFASDEAPEAVAAASVAATVAIQMLLTIGQKDAAERQGVAFERLYRSRPTTLNEEAIAEQLLLSSAPGSRDGMARKSCGPSANSLPSSDTTLSTVWEPRVTLPVRAATMPTPRETTKWKAANRIGLVGQ